MTKRFSHLEVLQYVINPSTIKGKSYKQVDADYRSWKKLKEDYGRLKTESKIKKLIKKIKRWL